MFLPALRGARSAEVELERKGVADRVLSSVRGGGTPGQPWPSGDWWVDKAVEQGFEVNPWIYRCVMKKGHAAIKHPYVVRYGDPENGEIVPVDRDPTRLTRLFNIQANPWERGKMFRYRMLAQYLLSPKGIFIEVVRNINGGIAMLDLWEPDLVEIIPAGNLDPNDTHNSMPPGWADPIHSFRLRLQTAGPRGGYDTLPRYDPNASWREQPRSVHWVRSPHPTLLYRGTAPITAAALSADLDQHARIYNQRYLKNDGRPGGLVMLKGNVGAETIEAVRTRFEAQQRAGRTMVVSGDSMEYVDLSTHPRDAQWENTRKATKEEILMVFGVPESVAGNASGRTFDNADAEWGIFWEEMGETLAMLDDQLDLLTGAYDDSLYGRHDLSDNWFLNRHKREAEDRLSADQQAGFVTIDEVRKAKGLAPLNVPATRCLWLPGGKVPIAPPDHPGDQAELAKLMPVGQAGTDPAAAAQAGAQQGAALGGRIAGNENAARSLALLAGKDALPPGPGGLPELEGKESRERDGSRDRARDDAALTEHISAREFAMADLGSDPGSW